MPSSPSVSPSNNRLKQYSKLQSSVVLGKVHKKRKWGPILLVLTVFLLVNYWLWFSDLVLGHGESDLDKMLKNTNIFVPLEQYGDILNNKEIAMDDPKLVHVVRKILIPPSTNSYNFDHKEYVVQGSNPSGGQTQAVADILMGFGGDGFFIECGANDGEWHSNTIWLERTLGWKGLLIEADPSVFYKLVTKHRNAWTGHFCLSNFPYPNILPFYQDKTLSGLGSGLIKSKRYYANHAVDVQCIPLYTVLLAVNRTTVDFFSLDVEGSELDILKTVPFDKVIFKVITIEHVVLKEGKVGLRKFMESKGYIFYRTVVDSNFLAGDSIFIHNSVKLTPEQEMRIGEEDSLALRLPRA